MALRSGFLSLPRLMSTAWPLSPFPVATARRVVALYGQQLASLVLRQLCGGSCGAGEDGKIWECEAIFGFSNGETARGYFEDYRIPVPSPHTVPSSIQPLLQEVPSLEYLLRLSRRQKKPLTKIARDRLWQRGKGATEPRSMGGRTEARLKLTKWLVGWLPGCGFPLSPQFGPARARDYPPSFPLPS